MKYALLVLLIFPVFSSKASEGCLTQLASLVCVVNAPKIEKDRYRSDRECLSGVDKTLIVQRLKKSIASYPDFLQRKACSLKKIYIEKEFFGNAWSDTGIIAINKNLIDANSTEEEGLSGFEQLTFGGKAPGYKPTFAFPAVHITPASASALTHIFLHELAHTLDYDFDFQKKGWGTLQKHPDFPLQKKICLNNCHGNFLTITQALELYQELSSRGFVSQLSATSPMEDFAETFAFTIENDFMRQTLAITIDKQTFEPLKSPAIQPKLAYIRNLIDELKHGSLTNY